jgi:hypothetical protein
MDSNFTRPTSFAPKGFEFAGSFSCGDDVETRLNELLAINRQTAEDKALFASQQERVEAELMETPIKTDKAFALFGLMLGTFPPLALFTKFVYLNLRNSDDYWVVALLLFVNLVCALTGYFSGQLIGKIVAEVEKYSWTAMLLLLPFIGILWGIISGGAGGLFIFVIGAVFGAIIAAMVGAVALPAFTILHRLLKKGDSIERDHFLPLAIGITLVISAILLGTTIR